MANCGFLHRVLLKKNAENCKTVEKFVLKFEEQICRISGKHGKTSDSYHTWMEKCSAKEN